MCLEGLAHAISRREPVNAVRLAGAAEGARRRQQARLLPREERERALWLNRLRQTIGSRAYDRAWDSGATSSGEQAIDFALALQPGLTELDARQRQLTAREHEIARLAAAGLTNAQIGERLVIAEGTVHRHLAHIRAKLGVHTRAEIAHWCQRNEPLAG
jgi:DNA-binding CsgD family transcriptional regulator